MWRGLKLWVGELVAGYLIGRAWLELVDLTAKHVRKQPPALTIEVGAQPPPPGRFSAYGSCFRGHLIERDAEFTVERPVAVVEQCLTDGCDAVVIMKRLA